MSRRTYEQSRPSITSVSASANDLGDARQDFGSTKGAVELTFHLKALTMSLASLVEFRDRKFHSSQVRLAFAKSSISLWSSGGPC